MMGKKTHLMTGSRQYRIWKGMKSRCNNENERCYNNYGGRGITYDPKRETFEGFREDMEEGYSDELSIDRIDNDGNYCKENCRWASIITQNRNTRRNNIFEYKGVKGTILYIIEKLGLKISCKTVSNRIYTLGREEKEAFSNPIKGNIYKYKGEIGTSREICEKLGVKKATFFLHIKKGLGKIIEKNS